MTGIRSILICAAVLVCAPAYAQMKPCEELKTEIEGKLKAKGVAAFTLEVVPAEQIKDQKVVGSCDGGKNKVTYSREGAKKTEGKEAKAK